VRRLPLNGTRPLTVLLPRLAIAQQSQQLPQPRQPGQWCPIGWIASGNYCVPGSDKAPQAVPSIRQQLNAWLAHEPDSRQLRRLLRPRRERPRRCRTAEKCDELGAFHSITSSARASKVGGFPRSETWRP
jgi:hypothetical protein